MDQSLNNLSEELGSTLQSHDMMLAVAESCTGGWVSQAITATSGSSAWFDRGFITYSNAAKIEMLGVKPSTLQSFGAVSGEVVREMAEGALNNSSSEISLAISGIAGPAGATDGKPVGTVCFAWVLKNSAIKIEEYLFSGDRESVRYQSVVMALKGVVTVLKGS